MAQRLDDRPIQEVWIMRKSVLVLTRVVLMTAASCGGHGPAPTASRSVNFYNWAANIAPDTVANFERETGIKVIYDTYESDEVLETKLLTGHTNYDVVVPSDVFFERLIRAGVFRKLDKNSLPNTENLDPQIMGQLAVHDPGNLYGLPYTGSTTGLGYNVDKIRERLGSTALDSWALILDPKNAAKFQDCGISIIDSPTDVIASVLIYLGKDPNSRVVADLDAAADTLTKIRPFVRSIVSVGNIVDLANGNICLVLGWSGDMVLARYRAQEAGNGVKIRYFIPREGGVAANDVLAIPADAPHPDEAQKFLNYLMRPDVIAGITNALKFPNGNRASLPFVQEAIKNDPEIYPSVETRSRLHSLESMSPDFTRLMTRIWTRFRTGQ
jgi:putrescine transport system substrate-binding protein